jgi:hypothetical protein
MVEFLWIAAAVYAVGAVPTAMAEIVLTALVFDR